MIKNNKQYIRIEQSEDFVKELNEYGIVIILDSVEDISELRYLYEAYLQGRHYESSALNARAIANSKYPNTYSVKIEVLGYDSEAVNITVYQL